MSSVLRPIGPEQEQTYWWRRLIVIAAAVVLVGLVIALVVGGTSTGSAVSAQPSSPPSFPAPPSYTPSPYTTPTPTPTPSASETAGATPAADGTADPSTSATSSVSATSSASASSSPSASSSKRSATPEPSTKPSASRTKAAPVLCAPGDLRATLTGRQRLKPEQRATFALSLINGSDETCIVEVTPKNFALTIYSGTDRIWSTADCSKAVEDRLAKLEAEAAFTWSVRWDGRRSRPGCKTRPEIPRPGTYVATAKLDGAKPVQLRMILRG